ncbi:MAG: hypothetical protein ACRCVI_01125 [Mycoplasmoidaceae bacterium]
MKKKLKISLVAALLAGTTLAITLPLVSCASNDVNPEPPINPDETTISLNVEKGNQNTFDELGLLFTRQGNISAPTNKNLLTEAAFNKIIGIDYTKNSHPQIWNKLKEAFIFQQASDAKIVDFDLVVNKIIISGTYPSARMTPVNLNLKLELNSIYQTLPSALNEVVQIGITGMPLTIQTGSALALENLATEFATFGRSDAKHSRQLLTRAQFQTIINRTYDADLDRNLWTKFQSYFIIKNASNDEIPFIDAVKDINVSGTFQNSGPAMIQLQLELYSHLFPESSLSFNLQIGVFELGLIVTRSSQANLNNIGRELAKLGNPSAFSNEERLTRQQYNQIIDIIYNANTHASVFNALANYFSFATVEGEAIPFNHVVRGIGVEGTYPFGSEDAAINVKVRLIFNNGYLANNVTFIDQNVQIGNLKTPLISSFGNQANLENLGIAFQKVGKPSGSSIYSKIIRSEYDQIINAPYSPTINTHVWDAMGQYFLFNKPNTSGTTGRVSFSEAVQSVKISGSFVDGTPQADQVVKIELTLKSIFSSREPQLLTREIKVGEAKRTAVIVVEGEAFNRGLLAEAWAKIGTLGNPWSHNTPFIEQDFNRVINSNVSASSTSFEQQAWMSFFNPTTGHRLQGKDAGGVLAPNQVIERISVSGTYPATANQPIKISLIAHFRSDDFYNFNNNPFIIPDLTIGISVK